MRCAFGCLKVWRVRIGRLLQQPSPTTRFSFRAYPNNPWRGLLMGGKGNAFAYPVKFFG
ncbi:hypothetical protein CLDAP_34070 [Caldilinea aerophila DSM 14535 = NBRC 104270]|uniref:Uncharacterized protein n=1 Tax=Caldilinea aerophila (strain DSM 14535 / JCM 11387 / NBRC 104270 / STL-6-O1) TaxID=926550 RepID=I0I859_CALAS|nr:hypothetical protein CLDAP_34070 [Caldilinea aerophila DSM 14535 = NBRC 104270]